VFGPNKVFCSQLANRISWEIEHGPFPEELEVMHKCDNPPCVNPAHLELGTHTQNMADRDAKGRVASGDRNGSRTHPESFPCGSKHHQSKLNEESIIVIRAKIAQGVSSRSIALQFKVARQTIDDIRNGVTWKHIKADADDINGFST
jgi:hypothetical protein